MNAFSSWQTWAVLSAIFAALTAIFAKVGVENISSDLATFVRTIVVIVTLGFLLVMTGQFQAPGTISGRTYLFLLLSGLGTGASWLCYFRALKIGEAAKVAPIDKLSVVLVAVFGGHLSWRAAERAELARHCLDRGGGDPRRVLIPTGVEFQSLPFTKGRGDLRQQTSGDRCMAATVEVLSVGIA